VLVSHDSCAPRDRSSIGICSTRTSRCAPPLRAACSPRVGRPFATGPWTSHLKRCAPAHHSVHSHHSLIHTHSPHQFFFASQEKVYHRLCNWVRDAAQPLRTYATGVYISCVVWCRVVCRVSCVVYVCHQAHARANVGHTR
jgi:hypothetical protein